MPLGASISLSRSNSEASRLIHISVAVCGKEAMEVCVDSITSALAAEKGGKASNLFHLSCSFYVIATFFLSLVAPCIVFRCH